MRDGKNLALTLDGNVACLSLGKSREARSLWRRGETRGAIVRVKALKRVGSHGRAGRVRRLPDEIFTFDFQLARQLVQVEWVVVSFLLIWMEKMLVGYAPRLYFALPKQLEGEKCLNLQRTIKVLWQPLLMPARQATEQLLLLPGRQCRCKFTSR